MHTSPPIDVLVIGAGPAGAVAAALARRAGYSVRILEKLEFPRFQIGESLLPQCMTVLERAGMLKAVEDFGFQHKNGAQIVRADRIVDFVFSNKTSPGYDYTYQVTRADFDLLLAREAEKQGAELHFNTEITAVDFSRYPDRQPSVVISRDRHGVETRHQARFVLDASGFGRTLPRLLKLDKPANFPVRAALFTHVEDHIDDGLFDRNKIRVGIHPDRADVWYWLIPLAGGRCSVGVVAADDFLQRQPIGADADARLWQTVNEEPGMRRMLRNARQLWPAREIRGYASSVTRLAGPGYALLGNAGEFLDPVFSSGVTIALNSAAFAVAAMHRELQGETVDWDVDFAKALMLGVDTFRGYVETWYEGSLQEVMFSTLQVERMRNMMCGVLAGYAWDTQNPYVGRSGRRLRSMARTIRGQGLSQLPRTVASPGS
ncbi:MAG: NAD(P)/FAD-dependent oxidoreductase [Panacagrimonas sp.]